jgi:hypothetical protein
MNFKKLFDYSQPLVAATTLFIIAIFLVVGYAAQVVYDIKLAGDTVEVTGSAKEAVVADMGRLVINVETKTGLYDQAAGVERVQKAVDTITAHLDAQELKEYETPAGYTNTNYYYPEKSEPVLTGYTISRSIVVLSSELTKLTDLANDLGPLSGTGYTVTSGAIASESGRDVGLLRNASSGVVQVLAAGGVDISDYGSYDTSSLNKEVMVTVRATFELK